MNRPIRFRVWNKTPNDDKNKKTVMQYQAEDWVGFGSMCKGKYPSFALMQFTGIHDKNGKDVFCGDIYRTKHQLFVGEVFECPDDLAWKLRYKNGNKLMEDLLCHFLDGEVLGNVYEHGNLLNV